MVNDVDATAPHTTALSDVLILTQEATVAVVLTPRGE